MVNKNIELANRLIELVNANSPITANGYTVSFLNVGVTIPDDVDNLDKQLDMKYKKDGNTEGYISATIELKDSAGSKLYSQNFKKFIVFPLKTERGTYICNGIEKNLISQMKMKAGVYTSMSKGAATTQLRFAREANKAFIPSMKLKLIPAESKFDVTIKSFNKDVNFNILNFMSIIGFTDSEVKAALGNSQLSESVMKKYSGLKFQKNIDVLFKIFFASENSSLLSEKEKQIRIVEHLAKNASFADGSTVKSTLNTNANTKMLTKELMVKAIRKTMTTAIGLADADNKDDLKFKDVYNAEDSILEFTMKGLDQFKHDVESKLMNFDRNSKPAYLFSTLKKNLSNASFSSSGVMNSDVAVTTEEINPLFMEAKQREITQGGSSGISGDALIHETEARNLTTSGINKIDPVETPESGKIGIVQHITSGSTIKNKTIYIKVYKVLAGKAKMTEKNIVELDPIKEDQEVIAFNDSRYVEREGDTLVFKEDVATCRHKGEIKIFPVTSIKYIDTSAINLLGTATNSIPFIGNDDGARSLMGASMQKQAINLINREVPLVTTLVDEITGQTSDQKLGEEYGRPVISKVNGKVQEITSSSINIKSNNGTIEKHQYYNYFPLNQSYVNNELKVKVGDIVQKGQIIAEGWQTKDGRLALGANARVGYLPFNGYNYEDGMVISKSFADRMKSSEYQTVEVEIPKSAKGGVGSGIKEELKNNSLNAAITLLDSDGIAKVGDTVGAGSVLVGFMKQISKTSNDLLDMIATGKSKTTESYRYSEKQIPTNSYISGKIVRINVINNPDSVTKQKIVFSIVKEKPLKEGDKIAGRHGNKGTVSIVLADEEMPVSEDGKVLDVIISPLGVPSRKNLGQLFEAGAGLVAEKTGKQFVVKNFDHKEKDRVFNELKKIGIEDGKMKVSIKERDANGNIINVELPNKITVGNAYIMKLKHKVDDKIQSRNNNETSLNQKTLMPTKSIGANAGEKSNPQRLGEMEMSAMISHGAPWNILEMSTIKSDGGGDKFTKAAIFNAIATGKLDSEELDKAATPETVKVLRDTIQGFGLDVKAYFRGAEVPIDRPFSAIGIAPMNQKKFIETIGKDREVYNPKSIQTRQLVGGSDKSTVSAETKGGLFDAAIFGTGKEQEDRNKWGYIKLPTPVPNPIFMEKSNEKLYANILNVSQNDINDITGITNTPKAVITNIKDLQPAFDRMKGSKELVAMYKSNILEAMKEQGFKEGDIVDLAKLESLKASGVTVPYKAGGFALEYLLDKVNIDEEISIAKDTSTKLKTAKDLNKNYKRLKSLENLKRNGLEAKDLMLNYVPVVPTYLRPINYDVAKNQLAVNDLDKLYQGVLSSKLNAEKEAILDSYGRIQALGLAPKDISQRSKFLYDSVKKLQGMTTTTDRSGAELTALGNTIATKKKLIRKDMLGKRQDFSGRSVITINPNLALNEIAIPLDMAKNMYKPFVINKMISDGVATEREAFAKFDKMDSDARAALQAVADDRPAILNRAPTLHKYGIMAYKPIIKEKDRGSILRSIQLNPLACPAFNADFDGDTMAAHIPVSDMAKEEAKKILSPIENLINITDGSMIAEIRHEMALGLFQLTKTWRSPSTRKIKTFKTYKELFTEYKLGKIKSNDRVLVPISMKDVTAGQALFNWTIPDKLKHKRDFNKAWTSKEIKKLFKDIYSEAEVTNFSKISKMDIANILNLMKTLGFKASTTDAISIGISDFKIGDKAGKEITGLLNSTNLNNKDWKNTEKIIEDKLRDGLLDEKNPLQIMMESGARSNPQQIRKMFATIGTGMDVTMKSITPIKGSHFDSLSPHEFYTLGKDSRKGMYDRSVSTSQPGALTREMIGATQDVVITEIDCKTKKYISLKKSDSSVKGRIAAKNIISENNELICKKGQLITNQMLDKLVKDDTVKFIPVRSVSRCETVNGKCQKCYGAEVGTLELVKVGTAIGIIASQALGEPTTQMTMNTFHSGGANSAATVGLPAVKSILSLKNNGNEAALAKVSGRIDKISDLADRIEVLISGKTHKIKKGPLGESPKLRIKEGDIVSAGDFLTIGANDDLLEYSNDDSSVLDFTTAAPKTLFEAKLKSKSIQDALNDTRDYTENSITSALTNSNTYMDRKHTEVIVSKLTGTATVMKQGDSPYIAGQIGDINLFEKWNRENIGKNPIQYEVNFNGRNSVTSPENWVENISNKHVVKGISSAAATGAIDHLSAPKSRQMMGKMLNMDGMVDVSRDSVDSVNNKMRNFFETNRVTTWLDKHKK